MKLDGFRWAAKDLDGYSKYIVLRPDSFVCPGSEIGFVTGVNEQPIPKLNMVSSVPFRVQYKHETPNQSLKFKTLNGPKRGVWYVSKPIPKLWDLGHTEAPVGSITICSVYGQTTLFQMGCERSVNHSFVTLQLCLRQ